MSHRDPPLAAGGVFILTETLPLEVAAGGRGYQSGLPAGDHSGLIWLGSWLLKCNVCRMGSRTILGSIVFLVLLMGIGCVSELSHVMIGKARPPISPRDVKLYFHPPAKYEEIALIDTSDLGSFYVTDQDKVDTVIRRLKEQAASVGANVVLFSGIGIRNLGSVAGGSAAAAGNGQTPTLVATGGTFAVLVKETSGVAIFVTQE